MTGPTAAAPATPLTGRLRLLRAAVLGSASLALALGGHVAAGGSPPSLLVLAVCAVLLGLSAVTATARRVRVRWLLPLLGVQQALLHLVFDAGAAAAGCGAVDAHAGHAAGAALRCGAEPAAMAMPGWPMLLGHAVATLATAVLLARGERALWALAGRLVRVATARPSSRPGRRRPPLVGRPRTTPPVLRHRPASPRGPPVVVPP